MKPAAANASIETARAHPHVLRHTYGRNYVLRGVPIPVLQQWLGHQSLADTQQHVELAGAHHQWVDRLWAYMNIFVERGRKAQDLPIEARGKNTV